VRSEDGASSVGDNYWLVLTAVVDELRIGWLQGRACARHGREQPPVRLAEQRHKNGRTRPAADTAARSGCSGQLVQPTSDDWETGWNQPSPLTARLAIGHRRALCKPTAYSD
jgi:hypothetical protein